MQTGSALETQTNSPNMASGSCRISPIIVLFVGFLLAVSATPACSLEPDSQEKSPANRTFRPAEELKKLKWIQARLNKINKPPVKTIQSPDGDFIDCVLSHQQPAFDHPRLKGQKPMDPPERPNRFQMNSPDESFQLWRTAGESCPEGTVPIRRTSEEDFLRVSDVRRFGRKGRRQAIRGVRRDFSSSDHDHAIGYISNNQFYGAKANLNVWDPRVSNNGEFSLAQIWILSGPFGADLNTIEVGWQVSPELYGDEYPRFFTYWTNDAYQGTGCYNLMCSGFVQTSNNIAIGAAISPTSSYGGGQYDISIMVWKDPIHGNWWLQIGSGHLVGYWPADLFSHLRDHATMIQFGGEVVNTAPSGSHTTTQMGSGHFAEEGFGKASYFRNLQVVDWDNSLVPATLDVIANHPNCYNIQKGHSDAWGNYFFYGGPGRNVKCP